MNPVTIELQNPTSLVQHVVSNSLRAGPYIQAYHNAWCVSTHKDIFGKVVPEKVLLELQRDTDKTSIVLYVDRIKLLQPLIKGKEFNFNSLKQETNDSLLIQEYFDAVVNVLEAAYLDKPLEDLTNTLTEALHKLNDPYTATLIDYEITLRRIAPQVQHLQNLEAKLQGFENFKLEDIVSIVKGSLPWVDNDLVEHVRTTTLDYLKNK